MKKIYKQPVVNVVAVRVTLLSDQSFQMSGESASTANGSYDKALSRRGGFWEDDDE